MKGTALIDWFTFSVKEQKDPDKVISSYLHMDSDLFQNKPFGGLGYLASKSFNGISVFYEPAPDKNGMDRTAEMGVCVSMSGSGCRTFEAHTKYKRGDTPFWALVEQLHIDPLVNISRVDLAVDDREGFLDLDVIADAVKSNQVNSRIRKRRIFDSYDGADDDGKSVYFGASQSSFRIRIYDKAKEHFESDQPEFNQHWVRFEIVMKGKCANGMVGCMVNSENLGLMAANILNDKLSFIERDDSNISRCSVSQWWLDFLESFEAIKLVSQEEGCHELEHVFEWLICQIAPSLSLIREGKGIFAIQELLDVGRDNRTKKQSALLDDYRNAKSSAV